MFGDDAEIKSFEFHFKDHRNKKAQKLDSNSNDEFKQLCDRLLLCTTVAGYQAAKSGMGLLPPRWQGFPERLGIVVE